MLIGCPRIWCCFATFSASCICSITKWLHNQFIILNALINNCISSKNFHLCRYFCILQIRIRRKYETTTKLCLFLTLNYNLGIILIFILTRPDSHCNLINSTVSNYYKLHLETLMKILFLFFSTFPSSYKFHLLK